ncbi:MAG: hypothetical protein QY318_03125 [Candidatus Dojkabacteria bacterium]|nr:MAG: hypothetical protein QY318_03125 [Candidatus Dojkabacteria bacterium]
MKIPKLSLPSKGKKKATSNTKGKGGVSKAKRNVSSNSRRNLSATIFGLLFTILVTSMLISAALIAMPKTERFTPDNRFDLNVKDDKYWAKRFVLELTVKKEDEGDTTEKVEVTKGIIQRRLDRYDVEQVSIKTLHDYEPTSAEETVEDIVNQIEEQEDVQGAEDSGDNEKAEEDIKVYIEVSATSSRDQASITRLIGSRHYLKIMTTTPAALNSEDQLAAYLPENYDRTQFTRRSFRNIEIKQLSTTTEGEDAFFAIYKSWPHNALAWRDFLGDNAGKTIGIAIDGFVTPYPVPIEFDPDLKNPQQNPIFAPGVTQDPAEAQILDILYNSGVIPVEYSIISNEDAEVKTYEIDYIEVSAAFILSVIVIMAYSYFRNRGDKGRSLLFMLTSVAAFAFYVAVLKILSLPIDLPILLLEGLSIILLAKVLAYRTRSVLLIDLPVIMFFALLSFYGSGYTGIYGMHMTVIAFAMMLMVPVLDTYINKMKNLLMK